MNRRTFLKRSAAASVALAAVAVVGLPEAEPEAEVEPEVEPEVETWSETLVMHGHYNYGERIENDGAVTTYAIDSTLVDVTTLNDTERRYEAVYSKV